VVGLVALALIGLTGCQQDEITSYRVPRPAPEAPGEPKVRMLAAILPIDADSKWFIKLTGPLETVGKHEDTFRKLVASLDAADGKIKWALPEGWKEQPGNEFRHATLVAGDGTEVTLSKATGSVADNVNRWRDQVGLAKVSPTEIEKGLTKVQTVKGEATLVDLKGPGPKKPVGMGHPPFAGGPGEPVGPGGPAVGGVPFTYELPEGWKVGGAVQFSLLTLTAGEARMTVSAVGGGLETNVNRWRGQVGQAPVSNEQVRKDLQPRKIGGRDGFAIELTGGGKTILGAMVPQGGDQLYFKLMGPAEAVAAQKAAFDKFLASVKFEAGRGANDGK
jgi:hypothetical protein